MSGKPDEQARSNSDRISELGDRLHQNAGDEEMVAEIHRAMQAMVAENGESEMQIRAELQRRLDAGEIRPESFELVQEMLDRIALEKTTRIDVPITPEIPIDKTVKITAPVPAEVPHDQTVKIDTAFPLEIEAQAETPVLVAATDDDQEFINTAVIEDSKKEGTRTDDQLQVGSVIRDRFLLQEQVSGGSMGVVFKALDRRLAEAGDEMPYVAIKVVSSKLSRNANALRALQQEAAKGRCLSHPNIVRFIDLDRDDDVYYIVMEWLEGRSLAEILDDVDGQNVDLPMALNIVGQIGRALDYAHMRGVVHADVKPANIMITPDGHAKLLDFGIARIRQKQIEGKSKFDPAVLGMASPAYSSMQVLTGEDPMPADDVFSLACLMYRLVAGMRVFGPRNAADAAANGMEPQRPRGLNDMQWRALKKALSYSRVTRFPTPIAFIEALGPGVGAGKVKPKTAPDREAVVAPARQEPEPVMRAIRAPSPDENDLDIDYDDARRSPWRLAVIGAILIASVAVVTQTQLFSYIDKATDTDAFRKLTGQSGNTNDAPEVSDAGESQEVVAEDEIEPLPMDAAPEIAVTNEEIVDEFLIDDGTLVADEYIEPDSGVESEPELEPEFPAFDYSAFKEALLVVTLSSDGETVADSAITLQESADPAVIELTRTGDLATDLSVIVEETGFSGARSPKAAGQYLLENDGIVSFVAGQERAQMTISMSQNDNHEADEEAILTVRNSSEAGSDLAVINVVLQDDDEAQVFPPGLMPNTITFSVDKVLVREFDPAVRLDVIRKRPDNSFMDVRFVLHDISATEGQDYFAPRFDFVSFGPGQEMARILIPLGQDALIEDDETFTVQLQTTSASTVSDIWTTVTIIIRDDDQ